MKAKSPVPQTQNPLAAGRWRLDPSASRAEFRVPHFWGLVTVKGHFERLDGSLELEAGGERLAMTLEPTVRETGHGLDIDVTATVDQRQLGMTWSPLGMTRSPVTVAIHASLRPQP